MQKGPDLRSSVIVPVSAAFIVFGAALAYFGYIWGFVAINPNELLGSVLFWFAILSLALSYPLRSAAKAFFEYVREPAGAAIFAAYLAIHLLLYGFVLDGIFSFIYGTSAFSVNPGLLLTTNTFLPASALSTAYDLVYNPSILVAVPPVFTAVLSLYSVSVAVVIAILIVASVGKTRELGELCSRARKARSYAVLPAVGIVFGASCCLSVAGVITAAAPSTASLTSVIWVYYITYFLFPAIAIMLLYLNLRSTERISGEVSAELAKAQ